MVIKIPDHFAALETLFPERLNSTSEPINPSETFNRIQPTPYTPVPMIDEIYGNIVKDGHKLIAQHRWSSHQRSVNAFKGIPFQFFVKILHRRLPVLVVVTRYAPIKIPACVHRATKPSKLSILSSPALIQNQGIALCLHRRSPTALRVSENRPHLDLFTELSNPRTQIDTQDPRSFLQPSKWWWQHRILGRSNERLDSTPTSTEMTLMPNAAVMASSCLTALFAKFGDTVTRSGKPEICQTRKRCRNKSPTAKRDT
ncbi:hypothetical protein IV203_030270 [Nitzschia inconspicua]|uniref:Uncharacterized protein n=1 Tax=Nitzschia inconspicua TaxID=303405 RepID=A0A9K3LTC0_9STRA|nr:hypothetical protein IV203_030270 [Nitzschia inconspicua]